MDPTWEQSFEFPVEDENSTKCFVKFMMGAEGEEKQIGDECECCFPVFRCHLSVSSVATKCSGSRC